MEILFFSSAVSKLGEPSKILKMPDLKLRCTTGVTGTSEAVWFVCSILDLNN
jgi:hypothetical protein